MVNLIRGVKAACILALQAIHVVLVSKLYDKAPM